MGTRSGQEATQRPRLLCPRGLLAFMGSSVPCPTVTGLGHAPRGAGNASRCSILGPSILFFQELNANLSNLTSAFEKATAEKIKCQQEADATNRVISLANR